MMSKTENEEPTSTKSEPITTEEEELEALKAELAEFKDKYFRLLAEQENMRKRLMKERDQLTQYGIQNVLVEFLNPIDHMENALKFTENMSDEVKHWAHGFQMILTQFKDVLANHSVKGFESAGKPFDPHYHEAVETVETTEHLPGTVVSEIIRGYVRGDKIIRPARVTVSKEPTAEEEIKEEKEEEK